MAAQPRFAKINLVPVDEFEKSLIGRIMRWALTAGKSIVILTEFVVVLAFLSRFQLDRELNDLNEVITQKTTVVSGFETVETKMRQLQAKAEVVGRVNEGSIGFASWWSQIQAVTPVDTTFESIDLGSEQVSLKGISASESGFDRLLSGIKGIEGVESVSVSDLEFSASEGGVLFTILASLSNPTTAKR